MCIRDSQSSLFNNSLTFLDPLAFNLSPTIKIELSCLYGTELYIDDAEGI